MKPWKTVKLPISRVIKVGQPNEMSFLLLGNYTALFHYITNTLKHGPLKLSFNSNIEPKLSYRKCRDC